MELLLARLGIMLLALFFGYHTAKHLFWLQSQTEDHQSGSTKKAVRLTFPKPPLLRLLLSNKALYRLR